MGTSAIDKASEEVQAMVLQMADEGHTQEQIASRLVEHGITLVPASIGHHLRKNGIRADRHWHIEPANTFEERMRQYLDALESRNCTSFRLWDLNFRGRVWGACTRALLDMGIIEKGTGKRRWYNLVATKEILAATKNTFKVTK